jgi:uncharacterized damage-inducible protein DinB
MHDVLLRLMRHMRWADALFADALDGDPSRVPPDALRYFAHIAAVEHLWYARIHGAPARHPVWPELSIGESRDLASRHADLFERLLLDSDGAALSRVVDYRNSAGRAFKNSVGDIVTHVAMHGSHHRGQIARLLRTAGQEPPYTDYIQFARRDQ